MLRILAFLVIIWIIWRLFFKKSVFKNTFNNKEQETRELEEKMIVCSKCQTYVSSKDAIYSGAIAYCSEACLNDKV
ncbi:PP0621 family protein [Helicobacter cetorum]|uniref:PP0621 family protein n=1 Tax=Helicobacter cetorum TaxID=138563 RepID=UPI000CF13B76|nr:PP0621 family protein [Helicobacter cetorum]